MPANCEIEQHEYNKLEDVFTPIELENYSKFVNTLIGEVVFNTNADRNLSIMDLNNKSVIADVYDEVSNLIHNIIDSKRNNDVDDEFLPLIFNAEKIGKISQKTLLGLENLEENFDLFKVFHINSGGVFKASKLDIATIEENEEVTSSPNMEDTTDVTQLEDNSVKQMQDKGPNETDSYLSASNNVKTLFKLFYETKYDVRTKTYLPTVGSNKLPLGIVDKDAYNIFIKYFNNIKSEAEFMEKIFDPTTERIIPFIIQLREYLRLGQANQTANDRFVFQQLKILVAKPEVRSDILVTYQNEYGEVSDFLTNPVVGNRKKILNSWTSNFESAKTKNRNIFGKRFLTRDEIDRDTKDIASAYKILAAVGIEMSKDVIKTLSNKVQIERQVKKAAEDIRKQLVFIFNITGYRKVEDVIQEPLKDLKENFYNNKYINIKKDQYKELKEKFVKNLNKTIDSLIEIESEISTLIPSNTGRNALNETIYNISNETNITVGINYLNKSKSVSELLSTPAFSGLNVNPYFRNSIYNQFLFPNGVRDTSVSLDLSYVSGFKTNVGGAKSKLIRKLTSGEKLINDFKAMLGFGRTDVMRLETSNSYPALTMKTRSDIGFTQKNSKSFFEVSDFSQGILSSLKVQNVFLGYLNSEIEKVNSYEKVKATHPLISETYGEFLLFDKLSPSLKEALKAYNKDLTTEDTLFKNFVAEYSAILEEKSANFKRKFHAEGIKFEDIIPSNLNKEDNPFGEKGDQALDIKKGNTLINAFVINSLVQNIEFTIYFTGDPSLYESKKDGKIVSDLGKRMKGLGSTGVYTDVSPNSNFLVDTDSFIRTKSISAIRSIITKKPISKRDPKQVRSMLIAEKFYDGAFKPYAKNLKDKVTDGQGWATPDFLYELSIRQGWKNEFTDAVFAYEALIYKREFAKIPLSAKETKDVENHEKAMYANPELYAIPVMKAGYFGNQVDTLIDGKVYDKFSLAPLLPSALVSGSHPKLVALLNDMIDNQLDYVKHPSGTKGFMQKVVPMHEIGTAEADILHKELFKLQLAYSNESSINTAIPTQLLKLIYSNEFDRGVANNPQIQKLYNSYIKTLSDIQKENVYNLFKNLGITMNEDGDYDVDPKKFAKVIYKQAVQRNLDSNILNILKYNSTTNSFSKNPERFGYIGEIEKILAGIIDRDLRRFKVNGGDFPLITNGLSDKLKFYTDKNNKIYAAECRITLTKEYTKLLKLIHPDGKQIGNLKRLNTLLKNKEWREDHKKSLQIVVDRVPTQELNSMDALDIVEFFSPSIGNAIQLPDEIVIKAGLDFDYDKEKVLLPTFDSKGRFVEFKKTREKIEKEIVNLKKERDAFFEKNQYSAQEIYKSFEEAVQLLRAQGNNDTDRKEYKNLKDKLKMLKKDIQVSKEELNTLLQEINLKREADLSAPIDASTKFFKSLFGDVEILNLNIEQLNEEYLTEKEEQTERLRERNIAYQRKNELYKKISNYFEANKQLGREVEEHESEVYNKMENYSNQLEELYIQKANYFNNLSNRVVQNYYESLLRKNRFPNLIRPNSSDKIKQVSKDVSEITKIDRQLPSKDLVFDYLSQLDIFDIYNTAKNMLAPYAKINTIEKLLNYAGTKMSAFIIDRVTTKNKDGSRKLGPRVDVNHLILSPKEKAINRLLNGKYDISSKYGVGEEIPEGLSDEIIESLSKIKTKEKKLEWLQKNNINVYEEIQQYNSQSINATVDAAKDPFFINLMINYANVGVDILFTSIFKYPYKRTKMFLSHPVNLFYASKRNKGLSEKDALFEVAKRLKITKMQEHDYIEVPLAEMKNRKFIGGISSFTWSKSGFYIGENVKELIPLTNDIGDIYYKGMFRNFLYLINGGIIPSQEFANLYVDGLHLSKFVSNKPMPTDIWEKLADPKNDLTKDTSTEFTRSQLLEYELRTFANFFSSTKMNKSFRQLANYLSFDTNKLDGAFSIIKRRTDRNNIIKSMIVTEEELIKLEKASIIGAFKNEDIAEIAFGRYGQTIQSNLEGLYSLYEEYVDSYIEKNQSTVRKLPVKIMNDFLYSIIYNFGDKAKNGYKQITNIESGDIIDRLILSRNNPQYDKIFDNHPILNNLIGEFTSLNQAIYPEDQQDLINYNAANPNEIRSAKLSNLKLNKSSSLSKLERESFIQQFTDLLAEENFSKDTATNEMFKKLASDIADVGLAQSGFNESPISYREFIPVDYYEKDFNKAFQKFERLTSTQKTFYVQDFKGRFKENNRNYFPVQITTEVGTTYNNYKNKLLNLYKKYSIEIKDKSVSLPKGTSDALDNFDRAARLKPIKQNFKDGDGGRQMQPQFAGKSTMELILSGDRTRTTRSTTEINRMIQDYSPKNGDIKNLVGMIIKQSDNLGNFAFTEITGVYEFTKDYQRDTWQKEGWRKSTTDKLLEDYPYAIEFKLVNRIVESSITLETGDQLESIEEIANPDYQPDLQDEIDNNAEEKVPTMEEVMNDESMSLADQILFIQGQIKEIEDMQFASDINPYLYIMNNLPKLTIESAEKESGVKVGIKKDINLSFIDFTGKGVSVEKAAEIISESEEAERLGLVVDEVRNQIIDLIQLGKKAYSEKYLSNDELAGLKEELKMIQEELNEKTLEIGAHIITPSGEAIITSIKKASITALNLSDNSFSTVMKKDLKYSNKKSKVVDFVGLKYLVSPELNVYNLKTGEVAKLNADARQAVIDKSIEELPNKKCD